MSYKHTTFSIAHKSLNAPRDDVFVYSRGARIIEVNILIKVTYST